MFDCSENPGNMRLIEAPDYDDTHFSNDGIHLNTKGKAILQAHIVSAITHYTKEIEVETEAETNMEQSPGTIKKASLRSSQKNKQTGVQTRGKRQRSNLDSEVMMMKACLRNPIWICKPSKR